MEKKKILFTHWATNTFIQRDLDILRKHFEVKVFREPSLKNPGFWIKAFAGALWADVTFCWFANYQTFAVVLLSKILGRKSIVISGGHDAVRMPEINYGAVLRPINRPFIWGTYIFADKILAFSKSSRESILERVPEAKVETVYTGGINTDKFKPKKKREDLIITVARVKKSSLKRKGLETFVKAAKNLPNKKFVLIGKHMDESINYLKSIAPSNVEFTGFLPSEDLLWYMQRAKVYVQVSAHEGFGVAMAEAMSCECIPVVTERGAIPEVVNETGFYVSYDNPKATSEAIKKALDSKMEQKARKRIKDNFTIEEREKKITKIVKEMA